MISIFSDSDSAAQAKFSGRWPTAEELPECDDTPVDSELQNDIPSFAYILLAEIFGNRSDWFWGTDMGIYYDPHQPPLVPDGFLSIGVPRVKSTSLRLSYVLWEEDWVIPILALEVVSKTYGGEYDVKMRTYAQLGVLYYVVYNPFYRPLEQRGKRSRRFDQHQPIEVYRLEANGYVLLPGNPVWLPEIGLGIGCEIGSYMNRTREWVYWYNPEGQRYLSPQELIDQAYLRAEAAQQQAAQERLRAEAAQQQATQERLRAEVAQQQAEAAQQQATQEHLRAERLAAYLRSQGIDPEQLP